MAQINTETGRKIKILYLKDILLKYSNENHYISLPMIQKNWKSTESPPHEKPYMMT